MTSRSVNQISISIWVIDNDMSRPVSNASEKTMVLPSIYNTLPIPQFMLIEKVFELFQRL
jgi:hypothetical protein